MKALIHKVQYDISEITMNIQAPKVSIIIPIYGVEKYIERCARSLFEQTLDNIEYLFIDDCTPDKSIEILKSVLEEHPDRKNQAIIHRMEKNSGQAAVRKWGMLNAKGDYVIHCDSDDWVDTDMYRAMYEKAIEDDADVVVCDYVTTDGVDTLKDVIHIGCHDTDKGTFINNMLTQTDSWSIWNKMFKRAVCRNNINFPEGAMGEDLAIVLQLMLNCQKITYINRCLYSYFVNASSITRTINKSKIIKCVHQALNNVQLVVDAFDERGLSEEFQFGLTFLKLDQKELLLPLLDNQEVYRYWYSTFPELKTQVIKMNINWQTKMKYYLTLLGVGRIWSWYYNKSR